MIHLERIKREIDQDPKTIYIMKEQLEQQFPAHKHGKGELLFVTGGIAFLKTDDKEYYIPSQHYIWIPRGTMHNIKHNSSEITIHSIYFVDEDDLSHPFYGNLGIYPVNKLLQEMMHFTENWQGNFSTENWQYEFLLTIKHLLCRVGGKKFSIQLPRTEDKRLLEITKYINQHIQESLSLSDIALEFGISVRNLTRLFQQGLHISFLQYVKMLRIIKAMDLLQKNEMNISQVAYHVGYSSIAAFSNTFQQLVNMRPSDFKLLK
ncbi:helix-turn-helix domain-containing protein [Flavobacterium sp. '19STA2R22 D10 B1']|uniref:helix-turn-helix domain-containing protein n=1 Tax=Flavobacterium aerium TaxID=3037261 RepID=UPI00278C8CFF|nr:AraC family transcriptional regulator [Flavobacterium sp. '19STA2R22 D10 B1']